MATVEDLANDVLVDAGCIAGIGVASRWVRDIYRRYVRAGGIAHLRRLGQLSIPAAVSTGTVDATRGSLTITGDSTASTAWDSAGILPGRHIRLRVAWYEIAARSSTTITLTNAFAEDDVDDGTYYIVERFHALPADCRTVTTVLHMRTRRDIIGRHQNELDIISPERHFVGGTPVYWAQAPKVSDTGTPRIETYPYPTTSEVLHYTYYTQPLELECTSEVPAEVDTEMLKSGAMMLAYRYMAGTAAREGEVDRAGYYRNEYRAQETVFNARDIPEAARSEALTSDKQFIIEHASRTAGSDWDVRDARTHVWLGQ